MHGDDYTYAQCASMCVGACSGFEADGCTGDKQCTGGCYTIEEDFNNVVNGNCIVDGSQKVYHKAEADARLVFNKFTSSETLTFEEWEAYFAAEEWTDLFTGTGEEKTARLLNALLFIAYAKETG